MAEDEPYALSDICKDDVEATQLEVSSRRQRFVDRLGCLKLAQG